VICVTPVKNEAWILDRFLTCASLWADVIVVADQGSEDGSREIARSFPKVRLVENSGSAYDEGARQRLLLDAAREIPGPRLIVALDADEALSANALTAAEWDVARAAEPGTVLEFDWVNLLPGLERCWIPPEPVPFGFVDDGSPHDGAAIHSTRLPTPATAERMRLRQVKVLHYQYVNWARMKSKQCWYQCWEALNNPSKRPIQLYRQYHHMDAMPEDQQHPVDPEWFRAYDASGAGPGSLANGHASHYDAEVLDWLVEHGGNRFRRLGIWDVDWEQAAAELGRDLPPDATRDPRSASERAVHGWLARTQARSGDRRVRWLQRLLVPAGW
jgi:hypothetical protein